MLAILSTLLFYAGGVVFIRERVPSAMRFLAVGTLPVVWIVLLALSGLLWTLGNIPVEMTLAVLVTGVTTLAASFLPSLSGSHGLQRLALPTLLVLGLSAVCGALTARHAIELEVWGNWDSLFTWVLRARAFWIGGPMWTNAFSADLALLHPDYPPMLGWALCALWKLHGSCDPLMINWLFLPAWPAMVMVVLAWQSLLQGQGRLSLITALSVLLATPILWKLASGRIADFLLSYAILTGACWGEYAKRSNWNSLYAIAGMVTGWGGLIKNEGILWLTTYSLALTCLLWQQNRFSFGIAARNYYRGLGGPLMAIVLFKMLLAPPSDLAKPLRNVEISEIVQPGVMVDSGDLIIRIDRVLEPIYHRFIWQQALPMLADWQDWGATLVLVPILVLTRNRRMLWSCPTVWAVLGQAAGYYFVYITTPYHPYWHLSTSLCRITAHLIPVAVCALATCPAAQGRLSISVDDWLTRSSRCGLIYLSILSVLNHSAIRDGKWQLGNLPEINFAERQTIRFPEIPVASFVTDQLGIRDLYATQWNFTPTVLVVDRREKYLLARFKFESDLKKYCEQHDWDLQYSFNGLGWAVDKGGSDLVQPVTVARLQ